MHRRQFLIMLASMPLTRCMEALSLFASTISGPSVSGDFSVIKARLYDQYLNAKSELGPIGTITQTLRPDGSWPDFGYQDRSRPGLKCMPHMTRLLLMVRAYRMRGHPQCGDSRLKKFIHKALGFWLQRDPETLHRWFNEIGVPLEMCKILILLENELSPEELLAGLRILQKSNCKGVLYYNGSPATGQNLIWAAYIQIVAGCLKNSRYYVAKFSARAAQEIAITTKEGIQPDYSFHQHGPQLYSGGYGQNFSIDCAILIAILQDTRFRFPDHAIDILSHHILDGQQWMTRGCMWDFSVIGREVARRGKNACSLAEACYNMARLGTPRQAEFEAFAKRLRGDRSIPHPEGNRSFWRSDFMTHQRQTFYVSVRMSSHRVFGNESGNGEAIFNYHMGDGAMCLMKSGDEYADIFPFWDWKRVPGVTCENSSKPLPQNIWGRGSKGSKAFAGGVSDGMYGAAGFDFAKDSVRARKGWFFFDREIACLGADISSEEAQSVVTLVDQRYCKSKVIVTSGNNEQTYSLTGKKIEKGPAWVLHSGVGYLFPSSCKIHIAKEKKVACWYDINKFHGSRGKISADIFSIWLQHDSFPRNEKYSYIILPDTDSKELKDYSSAGRLRILSNTPQLQAVFHTELGMTQVIFWEPGDLQLPSGLIISADNSCMMLLRSTKNGYSMSIANPLNKGGDIHLSINQNLTGIGCIWDGYKTHLTFSIPSNEYAGQSVVRDLSCGRNK